MPGRLDARSLDALVRKGEIDTVLTVIPDHYGRLMGKRMVGRYFVEHVLADGAHACIYLLTYITDVSIIIQFLVALVGLGVAIDYALVMIFRFREELAAGETVEEGTLSRWHKAPGEFVRRDELLYEVETDKVVTDVPSPDEGYLVADASARRSSRRGRSGIRT